MDDQKIVELYWQRDQTAIAETQTKYGAYCYAIAAHILGNHEDAVECENDTYFHAWNSMPPNKPERLSTFLAMITRRLSLDKWRKKYAAKRGGDVLICSLNELEECIPSDKTVDDAMSDRYLADIISRFLQSLPETDGNIFLRRYWYFDPIKDIAARYHFSESKVKMILLRTRQKLRARLEKEGVFI